MPMISLVDTSERKTISIQRVPAPYYIIISKEVTMEAAQTKKRILVVDDEEDICQILSFNLAAAGYDVEIAHSAEEALALGVERFNLLLLDVMMEGRSGFELAAMLKESPQTKRIPIIFLTARDTEGDMLHGFHIGADDYVSKPFSISEVKARIKAVLGRYCPQGAEEQQPTITFKGLTLYTETKTATVDGQPISLTPTEYNMLYLLLAQMGKIFSREKFIEKAWPKGVIVTDRAVDVNITRLRKKIGPYASHITTRLGFGYYFME
jgi:DNA-binding response OmpR family regulator